MAPRLTFLLGALFPALCNCPTIAIDWAIAATVPTASIVRPHDLAEDWPRAVDADVPIMEATFGNANIVELTTMGQTLFESPEGADVALQYVAARSSHGTQRVTFTSEGLVGTITRRGQRFHATIPTRRGVYRLDGTLGRALVTTHRLLQLRVLPQPDYKHAIF